MNRNVVSLHLMTCSGWCVSLFAPNTDRLFYFLILAEGAVQTVLGVTQIFYE